MNKRVVELLGEIQNPSNKEQRKEAALRLHNLIASYKKGEGICRALGADVKLLTIMLAWIAAEYQEILDDAKNKGLHAGLTKDGDEYLKQVLGSVHSLPFFLSIMPLILALADEEAVEPIETDHLAPGTRPKAD